MTEFVGPLLDPFSWLLAACHTLAVSLGWGWPGAIVLLALLIRAALFPLFLRRLARGESVSETAKKLAQIRTEWAHDRDRMNQELLKVYETENVSPLGGCLPVLIQWPLFAAVFVVVAGSATGRDVGRFMAGEPARELAASHVAGAPLSLTGWEAFTTNGPILVPVLLAVTAVSLVAVSVKLAHTRTTRQASPTRLRLEQYGLPALLLVISPIWPVAVSILVVTGAVWSVAQQLWLLRRRVRAAATAAAAESESTSDDPDEGDRTGPSADSSPEEATNGETPPRDQ